MTQYATDFSEYTTGVVPSDWSLINATAAEVTVETTTGSLSGKALNFNIGVSSRSVVATWNDISGQADVEILARMKAPGGFEGFLNGIGVSARVGGASFFNGYSARRTTPDSSFNGANLRYGLSSGNYGGAGTTAIGSANGPAWSTSEWYWTLMRCNGTTISAWFWKDGDTPKTNASTPDLTGTNTEFSSGTVGVFRDFTQAFVSGVDCICDYFAVGTGGDAAPTYSGNPIIASLSDSNPENAQAGIVITGSGFSGSGNAVKISPTNNVADAGAVSQTITAESGTSITFTSVKGSLAFDTDYFLFVTDAGSLSNATGFPIRFQAGTYINETLINETGAAVTSLTGITVVVWHALPTAAAPNPYQVIDNAATDGAGLMHQKITRGALTPGSPVWVTMFKDGSPAKGTARKIAPVYS